MCIYTLLITFATQTRQNMNKTRLFLSALAVGAMLTSCGGGTEANSNAEASNEETAAPEATAESVNWNVNTEESHIRWEGGTAGAQVYSHFGSIKLQKGSITTAGEEITSGDVVVDMTTINPEDPNYSDEHPASDLVGHLSTEDFFAVEQNPTASFVVKSVEGNSITGDLTVRGKTNEETFTIDHKEVTPDGMMHLNGTLIFDRQKYDVAWAHYLEDVVLSDDITLQIGIVANKG